MRIERMEIQRLKNRLSVHEGTVYDAGKDPSKRNKPIQMPKGDE